MTPAEFLLARLADEEELARDAASEGTPSRTGWQLWTSKVSTTPGGERLGPRGSVEASPARVHLGRVIRADRGAGIPRPALRRPRRLRGGVEAMSEKDATRCPTCGRDGVKACVDERGRDLGYDHNGRPPYFPPEFDRIWPSRPV